VNLKWLTPLRLWLGIFTLWLVFLSGVLASYVGSPGILQFFQLQRLKEARQTNADQLQAQLRRIEADSDRLEKSPVAQHREIRRILGYAAPDELIFDFSAESK